MTRRAIATRNREPAYLNAPPRLRQSDFDGHRKPMPEPKLARILGRGI